MMKPINKVSLGDVRTMIVVLMVTTMVLGLGYAGSAVRLDDQLTIHLADDHMITMRVAWMMHATGQPYFNAGEAVAANTSLFWPILLSSGYKVWSLLQWPLVLFWLSITMTVAAAWIAATMFDGLARFAVLIAVLLSPSLAAYGASGWEHIPQMLCVTAGLTLFLRNQSRRLRLDVAAFGLLCLAFLFRPDSAPIVFGGWLILVASHVRTRPVAVVVVSLLALILPAAYLLLMFHYYGDFVPNTYYLKGAGGSELPRGFRYLTMPLFSGPIPVLLGGATVILLLRKVEARVLSVLAILWMQIAFVAFTGGDVFPNGRFLLVILPVVTGLFVLAISGGTGPGHPRNRAWVGMVLTVAAAWYPWVPVLEWRLSGWPAARAENAVAEDREAAHARLMTYLGARLTPNDGSIGLHNLGMGYYLPEFHITDFLGKAEPHIARLPAGRGAKGHNKWDYDYAFDTYDIAAAPFPEKEFAALSDPAPALRQWEFNWVFGRKLLADPDYVYLNPEALGIGQTDWGLFVRADLVDRFAR
ncbi:hypothetical protein [Oceanibium sediminis]|uniref:hypothetical protein n=1 Tax=Oceanibium sediminis TaxID=2026339 RepID=UPI000DD2EDC7|nr:hypothetical protein [Oceanibium sediminis]